MIAIREKRLQDIKRATEKDDTLTQLKSIIMNGWPEHHASLTPAIKPYFSYRDELTVQDGLVLRGLRIVIPISTRKEMKDKAHSGHVGINACIRRAKDLIYWPGMSKEIRQYVECCDICSSMPDKQAKEPLIVHETPSRPWEKVATDIFTVHNRNYLLTADYFSNFFEIDYLPDMTSGTVIAKLKHHFARYGCPVTVVSDDGTQYTSDIFKSFSESWGFEHCISTPGNSQSNGLAESHVKIAKKLMIKSAKAKEDPYLAILNYRNTPTENMDTSPAQRLMGRRTLTTIPTSDELLRPQYNTESSYAQKLSKQETMSDKHINRKSLKPLSIGDNVHMQPVQSQDKDWKPAVVTKVLDKRTYEVERNGRTYRRNRRLLRRSNSNVPPPVSLDISYKSHSEQSANDTTKSSKDNTNVVPTEKIQTPPKNSENSVNDSKMCDANTKPINVKVSTPAPKQSYVTRSGRVVKPNTKYA